MPLSCWAGHGLAFPPLGKSSRRIRPSSSSDEGFTRVPRPGWRLRFRREGRPIQALPQRYEAAMSTTQDVLKPAAMAIPKEGYIERIDGPYGPLFPKTPANYGFSILGKVIPGREDAIRAYGKTIEEAVKAN